MADHPLLTDRDLDAEAQALLDRLISTLQERPACVLERVVLTVR